MNSFVEGLFKEVITFTIKSELSIEELKYMAKVKGIKGYTKMAKEELIKNLED